MQNGKKRAIFIDRDGVINDDTNFITRPEDFIIYPFTAEAIRLINQSEYLAIVITNQSAVARGMISEDELKLIHHKMDDELAIQSAKMDSIYYCPHHPDFGENRNCSCRKPLPGMLLQAAEDFNIDLLSSFMIGDNERDIIAGKAAGCKTIGVKTGKGLKNSTTQADFMVENLIEAVHLILNR